METDRLARSGDVSDQLRGTLPWNKEQLSFVRWVSTTRVRIKLWCALNHCSTFVKSHFVFLIRGHTNQILFFSVHTLSKIHYQKYIMDFPLKSEHSLIFSLNSLIKFYFLEGLNRQVLILHCHDNMIRTY